MAQLRDQRSAVVGAQPVGGSARRVLTSLVPILADTLVIALATLLALVGRNSIPWFNNAASDLSGFVSVAVGWIVAGWVLALYSVGSYSPSLQLVGTDEYRRVVNASVITAAAVGIACFLLSFPLSRGFFFLLFVIGTPLLLARRLLARRWLHRQHRHGRVHRRVVLAGVPSRIADVLKVLRRERWLGYDVVGLLTPLGYENDVPGGSPCSVPRTKPRASTGTSATPSCSQKVRSTPRATSGRWRGTSSNPASR